MSELVSQLQQGVFASPVNGQSPISATDVLGNDNAMRATYNAHDADAGLHFQSGAIATRPAAGILGRKWFASDTRRLSYDNGSAWVEHADTVSSVFGRTGVVTAQANDYAFSQLNGQIASGQVPVGTVTQHQAALSIAGSQLTGSLASGLLSGAYTGVTGLGTLTGLNVGTSDTTRAANVTSLQVRNAVVQALIELRDTTNSRSGFISMEAASFQVNGGAIPVRIAPEVVVGTDPGGTGAIRTTGLARTTDGFYVGVSGRAYMDAPSGDGRVYVSDGTSIGALRTTAARVFVGSESAHNLGLVAGGTERVTVNAATGAVSCSAGLTAASLAGVGTSITALNATELTSGTIPSARLAGAYTGITGLGTLTALTCSGTLSLTQTSAGHTRRYTDAGAGGTAELMGYAEFSFAVDAQAVTSTGVLTYGNNSGSFFMRANGAVREIPVRNGATVTSARTGGAAAVLPANPVGYVPIVIDGSTRYLPYYT